MQRLFHITPTDYDDFIQILMTAKQTFMWAGDGGNAFGQVIHAIKRLVVELIARGNVDLNAFSFFRNKSCKKELLQRVLIVQNQQVDQP